MTAKTTAKKPLLTWTRQPDGSYTDAARQFHIERLPTGRFLLRCPKLGFEGLLPLTLRGAQHSAEEMVVKFETQKSAESRTKKGKKAPKAKAEEPAAPPPPPPSFTITWPAEPKTEDWQVSIARVWYSECGLYRVVRLEPKHPDTPVRFGACRKTEKGWRPVEADPHHRGTPRTFPTLAEAAEAVERYHVETAKIAVVTKSEEMMSHATAAGLDKKPVKAVETPADGSEPAGKKGKKAKKPRPEGTPAKGRYDLLGFPVTAVLRWMGKAGWTATEALVALAKANIDCSPATVKIQVRAGSKGERGEPAALSPDQAKHLNAMKK